MTAHRYADAHREEIEEAAVLGPGVVLRGAEIGMVALLGLLVCPPLAILAVVVVVPLLALAIVAGVVAAIVAVPYLLVRRVAEHHRTHHSSAFAHGLRRLRAREA
jgi:Flp pilus assembly protein TadB